MAWFRKGRGRERLEVVHVELGQRGALLLGEVDEAVLARAAAAGAAGAARPLVVRPLVVGQALGLGRPALEPRRAAALGLGHLLAGQVRLRRRLLLVLLHVAAAVRVDADGQHECLVAFDALVALDLVLGLGGGGDVRRHLLVFACARCFPPVTRVSCACAREPVSRCARTEYTISKLCSLSRGRARRWRLVWAVSRLLAGVCFTRRAAHGFALARAALQGYHTRRLSAGAGVQRCDIRANLAAFGWASQFGARLLPSH